MKKKMQILKRDEDILLKRYQELYGSGEYAKQRKNYRKKMKIQYGFLILFFALLFLYSAFFGGATKNLYEEENGYLLSIQRTEEGENRIPVEVTAVGEKEVVSKDEEIYVKKETNQRENLLAEEPVGEKIGREIDALVRSLGDSEKEEIKLPTQLSDGTKLYWKAKKENPLLIVMAGWVGTILLLYIRRFDELRKEEKMAKESVITELPEFINKLVLLLNAGLVVTTAFIKIVEDYQRFNPKNSSYFYHQLENILVKMKETNAPMQAELTSFAKRTGVHQFIRVANTITDNVEKGANLGGKLQRENDALWYARKKQSEEKGRIAESKLTLPLVILLVVLVMVTIAPAMLKM